MDNKDTVEYYLYDKLISVVRSSIVPPVGSLISIKKIVYKIKLISYAIDHAENRSERSMRCNIDIELHNPAPTREN